MGAVAFSKTLRYWYPPVLRGRVYLNDWNSQIWEFLIRQIHGTNHAARPTTRQSRYPNLGETRSLRASPQKLPKRLLSTSRRVGSGVEPCPLTSQAPATATTCRGSPRRPARRARATARPPARADLQLKIKRAQTPDLRTGGAGSETQNSLHRLHRCHRLRMYVEYDHKTSL